MKKHLGGANEEADNYLKFEINHGLQAEVMKVPITGGPDLCIELNFYFGAQSGDKVLLLSKWPIGQSSLSSLETELSKIGGTITAVHNNWLYDNPKIVYVQWQIKQSASGLGLALAKLIKKLKPGTK